MSTPSHHPYESQDGVSCVSSSIQASNTSHSLPIMSHLAPSLTPYQLLGVSADRLSEVVEGKLVSFLVIDISVIVIYGALERHHALVLKIVKVLVDSPVLSRR